MGNGINGIGYYDDEGNVIIHDVDTVVHNRQKEYTYVLSKDKTGFHAGENCYLIHTIWMNSWLEYIKGGEEIPGPISNEELVDICRYRNIKPKKDFKILSKHVWEFLFKLYGGGPVLFISVPYDLQDSEYSSCSWVKNFNFSDTMHIINPSSNPTPVNINYSPRLDEERNKTVEFQPLRPQKKIRSVKTIEPAIDDVPAVTFSPLKKITYDTESSHIDDEINNNNNDNDSNQPLDIQHESDPEFYDDRVSVRLENIFEEREDQSLTMSQSPLYLSMNPDQNSIHLSRNDDAYANSSLYDSFMNIFSSPTAPHPTSVSITASVNSQSSSNKPVIIENVTSTGKISYISKDPMIESSSLAVPLIERSRADSTTYDL